jgi:hypothetical protein
MKQNKMSEDRFAENWQKAFSDKTQEPPGHVWEKLDTQLNSGVSKEPSLKELVQNKIVLSSATAILSAGLLYLYLTPTKNVEIKQPLPTNKIEVIERKPEGITKKEVILFTKLPNKPISKNENTSLNQPKIVLDSVLVQQEITVLRDSVSIVSEPIILEKNSENLGKIPIHDSVQNQQFVPNKPMVKEEKAPVLVEDEYYNPNALPSKTKTKRTKKGKFSFGFGGSIQQ